MIRPGRKPGDAPAPPVNTAHIRRVTREPRMAEVVARQLRAAIIAGTLAPGSRMHQETLAEQLAVSRAPIREALVTLKRDIVYNLCQYGMGDVWEWAGQVQGNCWRTTATRYR